MPWGWFGYIPNEKPISGIILLRNLIYGGV